MGAAGGGGKQFRGIGYEPLPSQKRFHASAARFKGFSGPVGSGKSQALCHEAIRLAYLNPGRMGLLAAPTYTMLRDATQAALFELLESNKLPYEFLKAEQVLTLKDTKSRVLFRSLEEYERLRGTNLAWFGVDELTYASHEAWQRLEARLRDPKARRLCGFAVWTPRGHDWVYERFMGKPVDGYDVVIARPFENKFLLAQVPDFYERLRRSYDEKFFQQEVLGEYLNTNASRVYHAFDATAHVADWGVREDQPLLWALDFNVDPMCSVVAQRRGNSWAVVDEIVLSRASTAQACEEFCKRFARHQAGVVVYGDAAGNHRQTTGSSDYEVVRQHLQKIYRHVEYRVPRSNPAVRDRVALVNGLLKSAAGEVRLWIHPQCQELRKDFEQLGYKGDSSVVDKERDPRRSHLSDALGYLLWEDHKTEWPRGPQTRGLF